MAKNNHTIKVTNYTPPCEDTDYHPNLTTIKQLTNPGGKFTAQVYGQASYIPVPDLASDFMKFGLGINSSSLGNVGNDHPPEIDDVVRRISASDVKKLVVRTTTNFEVDQDVVSRIISEAEMSNFPVKNSYKLGNTSEYHDPQPSTSSWSQDAPQYGTNQPKIEDIDPLSLENTQPSLSIGIIPYE